ncbi:MAG: rRNA maturation RNase YbeY [Proteobacteria bacterium]|nr:MAG: rRNA maturation RNase YbeY [Pseudomonadota bacterium]
MAAEIKKLQRSWRVSLRSVGVRSGEKLSALKKKAAAVLSKIERERDCRWVQNSTREVSILLTNDRNIRRLNKSYRGKDKVTDVLSFSLQEGSRERQGLPLGDVVISVETAKRQSREFGCTFKQELNRLLVHGLLHLCGYDHEKVSASKARRMRSLERRLLKGLVANDRETAS